MNYFETRKILVPFDFSELAKAAVEKAIDLAGNCEHVTVLHVVHPTINYGFANIDDASGIGMEMMPGYEYDEQTSVGRCEIDDQNALGAKKMLESQFSDARFRGIHFETTIDDAPHGITDFAAEHEFGLIVIPSHGRTGVSRLLIGSVAERVVRLAHCPVLVLRDENPDTP